MQATFQRFWIDFSNVTKSALFKTMGYSPGFCSKSVDFGHWRILTESLGTSPKTVRNPFSSMQATFQRVWTISRTYQNPPSSKPWAIAQAFCPKSVDFGPLRILTESLQTSPKTVTNPFASMQATFQRVWTISRTYQNPPSSKPWAIAQAFCSKSVDFGHLRILTESLPTCSKIVGNQLSSMQATFQRVWDDFSHLPKSVLFKTMGYSPGFLLKIGRFRTLANSHGIFTNKPKNSHKSICKHAGDVSESLGRFLKLTKIRPLQNHGL